MKILITGAAGFVGSSIINNLYNKPNNNITGIDNLRYGYIERLPQNNNVFKFIQKDVFGLGDLNEKFDLVIHCSAIAPLPECQKDPVDTIQQNVGQCASVVEFCRKTGTKNIIFFSSGAIYEGLSTHCKETDDVATTLTYPSSKLMAETYLKSVSRSYGINIACLRLFNLYGPRQDYFRLQLPLLGYMIKSLILNQEATFYASPSARRDYVYIDDLVDLVLRIARYMRNDENLSNWFEIFNVGSGEDYSVYEIVENLEKVSNKKLKYKISKNKNLWTKYPEIFAGEIPLPANILANEVDKIALCDNSKAKDLLNWSPIFSMEEGINECYKYASELLKNA